MADIHVAAAKNGRDEVVQHALDCGANAESKELEPPYCIEFMSNRDLGSLGAATEAGRLSVIKILLERHVFTNCQKLNAASLALSKGHVAGARQLLEAGGRDTRGYGGRPPICEGCFCHHSFVHPGLRHAVSNGEYEASEFLLQFWNQDEYTNELQGCLVEAARKGFEGLVRLLISRGAKVNEPTNPAGNEWQQRPVFVAISNKQWHIVATLEQFGASTDDVMAIDLNGSMGCILHSVLWSENYKLFPANGVIHDDDIRACGGGRKSVRQAVASLLQQ